MNRLSVAPFLSIAIAGLVPLSALTQVSGNDAHCALPDNFKAKGYKCDEVGDFDMLSQNRSVLLQPIIHSEPRLNLQALPYSDFEYLDQGFDVEIGHPPEVPGAWIHDFGPAPYPPDLQDGANHRVNEQLLKRLMEKVK
jgi:hypothetical protein